jgi:hypothetical protein
MNPFYRRIELKYPGVKDDYIDLFVFLHVRWSKKAEPDKLRADLQKEEFSGGISDPFYSALQRFFRWIGRIYEFMAANMGLMLDSPCVDISDRL